MIQVDHMASATIKNALVGIGSLEANKLLTEMEYLEKRRKNNGLTNLEAERFRINYSSRKLRNFIVTLDILRSEWNEIIKSLKDKINEELKNGLQEQVMSARDNFIKKDYKNMKKRLEMRIRIETGGFSSWPRGICHICLVEYHRTINCNYTFERVWERIEREKIGNNKKEEMSRIGLDIGLGGNNGIKRAKLRLVSKEELIFRYKDAFYTEGEEIKFCAVEKCKINTKPGEKIVKKGCNIPQALKQATRDYIYDLERRKIIRRSTSEWRNPIRSLLKPSGKIRLVQNLMMLNDITDKDPYELKNIRDVIDSTQGKEFFTVLDLKEGFYSIEIEEKDKKKTAFEFEGRVYEYNSMVMGYKNAPQIMQRTMNKILEDLVGRGVNVYMDDIIISAATRLEHDKLVHEVFKRMVQNNLKVNENKIQFALGEVELLGVRINGKIQTANEIKKNEALAYPYPSNVKELRRFLGLAGWFRPFIKDFATLTIKMTDSLKRERTNWKWNTELEREFLTLKNKLKEMKERLLADYSKPFTLKTDASNVGLGAVLLQERDGNLYPIQWASKKLTPTEMRYGITEKEMLAVFWGISKFEYELRGRKFKVVTDHKALENIRIKPAFTNNRVNRWIEKIQEFDFEIEYQKPENLVIADALSRLYENKNEEKNGRGSKILKGKEKNHVIEVDGKKFWQFDNGIRKTYPPIEERLEIVKKFHNENNHRAVEGTYYDLKKNYYWIGMKKTVENVVKRCSICSIINRKHKKGFNFIESRKYLEKIGLDILEIQKVKGYVIVVVDYYTRFLWTKRVMNKSAKEIVDYVESLCKENVPDIIITDNGREFCNKDFSLFCKNNNIEHCKVAVEAHQSNGRVERVIRTIREGLIKSDKIDFEARLEHVTRVYNESYHAGINMSPIEAVIDDNSNLTYANSKYNSYALRYKNRPKETFKIGNKVLICKRDNLKNGNKDMKGRFLEQGEIVQVFDNDSYLIKKNDGKITKRRYYDIKINVGDETTV